MGLDYTWLKTPDYAAPRQGDIKLGVQRTKVRYFNAPFPVGVLFLTFLNNFPQSAINNGTKVYVHCNGGRGRSAVVVICYLCDKYKWSPEAAYNFVKSKRNIASMQKPPPFDRQYRSIQRYVRKGKQLKPNQVVPNNGVAPNGVAPRQAAAAPQGAAQSSAVKPDIVAAPAEGPQANMAYVEDGPREIKVIAQSSMQPGEGSAEDASGEAEDANASGSSADTDSNTSGVDASGSADGPLEMSVQRPNQLPPIDS
jgi:hypothetical protein